MAAEEIPKATTVVTEAVGAVEQVILAEEVWVVLVALLPEVSVAFLVVMVKTAAVAIREQDLIPEAAEAAAQAH